MSLCSAIPLNIFNIKIPTLFMSVYDTIISRIRYCIQRNCRSLKHKNPPAYPALMNDLTKHSDRKKREEKEFLPEGKDEYIMQTTIKRTT